MKNRILNKKTVQKNNSTGSLNPGTILRNGTPSWWIELEAKDLRALRFDFGENDVENRNKLHDLIQKLAFENFDGLFCFKNPTSGHKTGHKWYTYDVKEEFKRMTSSLGADCQWKITSENEKFKICETYPPLLIGKVHLKFRLINIKRTVIWTREKFQKNQKI